MEEEAEKLMAENISKNFIDYEEYPQSAELCVSSSSITMLGKWNRDKAEMGSGVIL